MHKSQFETIVVSYVKGKEKKKILSAIGYEKLYGQ